MRQSVEFASDSALDNTTIDIDGVKVVVGVGPEGQLIGPAWAAVSGQESNIQVLIAQALFGVGVPRPRNPEQETVTLTGDLDEQL